MAVLIFRIRDKKIPAQRLRDAVLFLIDNFKYPCPTIADVISFDRKTKLYTHQEVVKSLSDGYEFNDYEMIEIAGNKRWIRK